MHSPRASMTHWTLGRLTRGSRTEMNARAVAVDALHPDARLLRKEQLREHRPCPPGDKNRLECSLIPGHGSSRTPESQFSDEQNRPHPGKLRRTATHDRRRVQDRIVVKNDRR